MAANTRQYRRLGRPWTADEKREYMRQYYLERRDELKARAKANHNPERAAARYQDRKDIIAKRERARREIEGDKIRERSRQYYASQPAPAIARANKRRAIQINAQSGDRAAYRAFVIACRWCEQPVDKALRRIDHVIPLARGGADDVANLCCACFACNARKGSKLPDEWRAR
jgi:5-methylcytosine-specific restriction endonuclease McrA